MSCNDLRAWAAVVRREWQVSRRSPAFWTVAGLGSVLAMWRSSAPGTSAALAAYQSGQVIVLGVGAIAILLSGSAAARDHRRLSQELVFAKSQGTTASLITARFVAAALSMLTAAAIVLTASALTQRLLGGTPLQLAPYLAALARSAVPISLAATLGFALGSLFATPLAAGIAAIYWAAVPLARSHIPVAFDLTLSQHWPLSVVLTFAFIVLTAGLHAYPLRSDRARARHLVGASILLFAAAALAAFAIASAGDDGLLEPDPVLAAMASQTSESHRRAPGFWLPNPNGRIVGLSDFSGRPVLLVFWGPGAPRSARAPAVLRELVARHRDATLAAVAVCLDRDAQTLDAFVPEAGDDVVLLWDRGRHFGDGLEWSDSPAAVSYEVTTVPTAVLLDQDHNIVEVLVGEDGLDLVQPALSRLVGKE